MKKLLLFVCLLLGANVAAARPNPVWMNLFLFSGDLARVTEADLDRLIAAGAEGIEFQGTTARQEDCARFGRYVRAHGIGASLNIAVMEQFDPSSADPRVRSAGVAYLKSRIDCAAALDAKMVAGPFILPWGLWPKDLSGYALHQYIETKKNISLAPIREVASYAEKKGIRLAYEPLTHWEMPGLNTLRETIAYLQQLEHPNVGVTLDISHEVLDGEGPAVFAQEVAWLAHNNKLFYVQVSAPHRGDVTASWLPWNDFFKPLRRVWNGPLTIEMMNAVTPFSAPNGGGLRLTRAPFENPFAVAAAAIRLTRQKWHSPGR